jgi:hypothetical protein
MLKKAINSLDLAPYDIRLSVKILRLPLNLSEDFHMYQKTENRENL